MSALKNVLAKIVHGDNNFCCLCLQNIDETTLCIDDEIFFDTNEPAQQIAGLIKYILGEEFLESVPNSSVCSSCQLSCALAYKFMKMCKVNCENLTKAVNSVTDSLDNTIPDIAHYINLYLTLNETDFTSRQYYDDRQLEKISVSTRLNQITSCKQENDKEGTLIKQKCKQTLYDIPGIPTSELILNHPSSSDYICKICQKSFYNEPKVRKHFFKFHLLREYKCLKCPQEFISEQFLKEHEKKSHGHVVCRECGKQFTNKYILKKHELNHKVMIVCSDCGRVYRSVEAFNNHKTSKVCQQKMKKSSKDGEYQCDVCKKTYCTKHYLAKHLKYEHGNAVGFRCKFCDKQFYSKSKLETHVVKHTREKKFLCYICDGRFGTQMALVYHTRLHTGEKPYGCEYCSAAFISASRRLDHTRRHHLQPNLECDICHVKFKATGSLLKHKKRHFNPNSRLNACRFMPKPESNCN